MTIAFSRDGMYYALQLAIGSMMFDEDRGQVISYREFCEKLEDPSESVWFEQMLACCHWLGKGFDRRDQFLDQILFTLESLSENLDAIIGDCFFLKAREEGSCVHFNRYGDQRYN